ncbi:MAG: 30S ribosomal protein S1 [Candidatus Palauibacterales bacterium]|nr:30S ribosomal protein S1 [Candidatus Palauibacterales bacterium]MDP2482263.1 30S ribosomal protein S1 [Candidatus Palauibacterales bacterium]
MSTKDEQVTANESPVEDTGDNLAIDPPADSAMIEEAPSEAMGAGGEAVDATDGDGEIPADQAASEAASGTDDAESDTRVESDGSAAGEEQGWTTVAYGMAEGMSVDMLEGGEYSSEEYDEMMALYEDTLSEIAEGEIVKAKVLRKTDSAVILDVGFKSEGLIPLEEFRDPEAIQPGDEVEVFLESLEDQEGVVVLSKKKADFLRVWEKIKEAYDEDRTVPGILKRKIKGGVTVDLMGVDAFLPGSQIALRRVPNVDELIGQEYDFKILKLNKRRRNIVVSRRIILEEERATKRESLKEELQVGQVRKGVVKNITDFGAFIDLGGMDGLLHITDMSWGRIGHPSELCQIGDELEVKILDIDWDRERISLGLKQLQAYPWEDVAAKYPVGSRVRGRVVSITNYGAFIELEKGVEGLVHISEMSWTRNVRHPSQLASINDEVECVVLRVDEEEKKISLGMKQTEEDPWLALPAKYPTGTKISGVVRNLTSFGAFVEVEPGIDGLVHISDMSWTRRVQHPSEVVRKGEAVEVVILSIDPDQKRISLGLKQVDDDPWYELAQRFEPGTETEGQVVRLLDKGLVVDLGDDVEGFVPISQLGVDEELGEPGDRFVEGDRLELKVLESDPINRRIVLSVTAAPGVEEREAARAAAPEAEPVSDPGAEAASDEARVDGESVEPVSAGDDLTVAVVEGDEDEASAESAGEGDEADPGAAVADVDETAEEEEETS